jgi:predicted DNA binding CopG/RHH family protein
MSTSGQDSKTKSAKVEDDEPFENDIMRGAEEEGDKAIKQLEEETAAAEAEQTRRSKLPKQAPAKHRTKPIAVRFDEFTLERLRSLAAKRNTGYQTLLKEFVIERLYEEEKRDGIIE